MNPVRDVVWIVEVFDLISGLGTLLNWSQGLSHEVRHGQQFVFVGW